MSRSRSVVRRAAALAAFACLVASAAWGGALSMSWRTIDGGGGTTTGGGLVLRGTIGQPEASTIGTGSLTITGGFWSLPVGAAPTNPADLNGDGLVDGADLGLLLGAWGGDGPADLNGDGVVDGADLGLLLGAWS